MNPDPAKTNQLKKRLAPGLWIDQNDCAHFSLPEFLADAGLPDTAENRQFAQDAFKELLKAINPQAIVKYRASPDDTGKDL